MNLELIDPFTKTVPDRLDNKLERYGLEEDALCCAFNRRGTYLAAGYDTGDVVIWDFVTRTVSRVVAAHTAAVTCVSWARRSRALLTASHDGHVTLWDLTKEQPVACMVACMGEAVLQAQLHPFRDLAVAVLYGGECWLVDTSTGTKQPALTHAQRDKHAVGGARRDASGRAPKVFCAAFDPTGDSLYLGTGGGRIVVLAGAGGSVKWSYAVDGCAQVHQIAFSRGRTNPYMVVGGRDRAVRLMRRDARGGRAEREFRDVVNQTRWDLVGFSSDAEHVVAGATPSAGHYQLCIWSSTSGMLQQQLKGSTGAAAACCIAWHPLLPFIAIAAEHGGVDVWGCDQGASWTAFAANFVELEANVEYEEKEDEFDIVVAPAQQRVSTPESARGAARTAAGAGARAAGDASPAHSSPGGQLEVDVASVSRVPAFDSDSEDESEAFSLSARPGDQGHPGARAPPVYACCGGGGAAAAGGGGDAARGQAAAAAAAAGRQPGAVPCLWDDTLTA